MLNCRLPITEPHQRISLHKGEITSASSCSRPWEPTSWRVIQTVLLPCTRHAQQPPHTTGISTYLWGRGGQAALNGNDKCVLSLVRLRVDINAKNSKRRTPLHEASQGTRYSDTSVITFFCCAAETNYGWVYKLFLCWCLITGSFIWA